MNLWVSMTGKWTDNEWIRSFDIVQLLEFCEPELSWFVLSELERDWALLRLCEPLQDRNNTLESVQYVSVSLRLISSVSLSVTGLHSHRIVVVVLYFSLWYSFWNIYIPCILGIINEREGQWSHYAITILFPSSLECIEYILPSSFSKHILMYRVYPILLSYNLLRIQYWASLSLISAAVELWSSLILLWGKQVSQVI